MDHVINFADVLDYVVKNPIPAWAALVSTSLAAIKMWETFWRDRIQLETSYFLTGEPGSQHEIIVANLSPVPVQVANWNLTWKPRWFAFWRKEVNVTPEETRRFKIEGHNNYQLNFKGFDRFEWGGAVASGRQLVLEFNLFGRSRPLLLPVGGGQSALWWRKILALVPRPQPKRNNWIPRTAR
ncbi:hypothetical protein KUV57_21665 [Epibacterium sp. DP7N7-1]|nr:hypothetical protein [Epibacterium sp. DP7N7-1]